MSTATQTLTAAAQSSAVAGPLSKLLADSYSLMAQTHLAHWNVEGPAFFQLHSAFQTQYEELFTAIDEIAERIRALDVMAPGGLTVFAKHSTVSEMDCGPALAKDFVAHLIEGHETVVASAIAVRDAAEKTGDLESQDLAIGRVQLHQKTLWMLKSFLKNL
jgi:starvation-inducible DNA-binding protein